MPFYTSTPTIHRAFLNLASNRKGERILDQKTYPFHSGPYVSYLSATAASETIFQL